MNLGNNNGKTFGAKNIPKTARITDTRTVIFFNFLLGLPLASWGNMYW